jgi:protoporphyrinogen oxidase
MKSEKRVCIIGGGFTGLAAAYELSRSGINAVLMESDQTVGGLAGSFEVGGQRLEKFYHHWFKSDSHVWELIQELNAEDRVIYRQTRTGMYFAGRFFKLSTPLDVLRFTALSLPNRLRLGMLALRVRRIQDWRRLECLTAGEWVSSVAGASVFATVWEPLLRGKFGPFASEISAVWLWNKLSLRGGSRDSKGREVLAYFSGGFGALGELMADGIKASGGEIRTGVSATSLAVEQGHVRGVHTTDGTIAADAVIATPALPVIAQLLGTDTPGAYLEKLRAIKYLANVCIVLELDRSLSSTYWLNVADPSFPFVGVIEHTNLESADTYDRRHIVYLSKYLPESDPLYGAADSHVLEYCLVHLKRMFPQFSSDWLRAYHVWRAPYAQPLVVRGYGALIPSSETPIEGFYISTMAQIYPEDRGTNYAIRSGREIARKVASSLGASLREPAQIPENSALWTGRHSSVEDVSGRGGTIIAK